ncbi:MAG: mechanosensitive ion channel [Deltaproteobacteria bacterium]|nr:mechanosensitive ion channel [Deltaproteobacteria bacterium]
MNRSELLQRIRDGLSSELFQVAGTPITGATLLLFLVIVLSTLWLASFLQRAVERLLSRRDSLDAGTVGVLSRLLRYLVLILGLSIGLHTVGINLSALFAAGALFAVALGFAMQNVVANFVSGIILLGERVIKPGDLLEVDGNMVRVTDMRIRATVVRTLDDENLVIPNSQLVQSTVKNFTLRDRLYRLRVSVGVAYESDLNLVKATLDSACRSLSWRTQTKDPVILLRDFANSSVIFEASVWVDDPWLSRSGRSDLREAIWWAFKEAGITIAFPQLDVHLDGSLSPFPEAEISSKIET